MAFAFEYWGLSAREFPCGNYVGHGEQQWNLFGRITTGRLALRDPILLPTASGVLFRGYIARFTERFTEWLGLPFYNALTGDSMPEAFCLCVGGVPGEHGILCPGVARSADV